MVLSPAKTMDLTPLHERRDYFTVPPGKVDDDDALNNILLQIVSLQQTSSNLCNQAKTETIVHTMKLKSKEELKQLLSLSANLATTAHEVSEHAYIFSSSISFSCFCC